jgi:hypothetical protein
MNDFPIPRPLMPLLGGPIEAMETAKAIIGRRVDADPQLLARIATSKDMPRWGRIASIYTLGFVAGAEVAPQLRAILSDDTDDADVRAHAAEALGNIHDRNSVGLLQDILGHQPPPSPGATSFTTTATCHRSGNRSRYLPRAPGIANGG